MISYLSLDLTSINVLRNARGVVSRTHLLLPDWHRRDDAVGLPTSVPPKCVVIVPHSKSIYVFYGNQANCRWTSSPSRDTLVVDMSSLTVRGKTYDALMSLARAA